MVSIVLSARPWPCSPSGDARIQLPWRQVANAYLYDTALAILVSRRPWSCMARHHSRSTTDLSATLRPLRIRLKPSQLRVESSPCNQSAVDTTRSRFTKSATLIISGSILRGLQLNSTCIRRPQRTSSGPHTAAVARRVSVAVRAAMSM